MLFGQYDAGNKVSISSFTKDGGIGCNEPEVQKDFARSDGDIDGVTEDTRTDITVVEEFDGRVLWHME